MVCFPHTLYLLAVRFTFLISRLDYVPSSRLFIILFNSPGTRVCTYLFFLAKQSHDSESEVELFWSLEHLRAHTTALGEEGRSGNFICV